MKHSLKVISGYLVLMSLVACSKAAVNIDQKQPDQGVAMSTEQIIQECTQPHTALGIAPQPIPGIPVMLLRHAECLGQTNILVAWWPGPNSRINFLYVEMIVEGYVQHLKGNNEFFTQKLLLVEKAVIDTPEKQSITESHMAVYKLEHVPQKVKK